MDENTQNSITTTYNYIWNGEKLVSQSDGTNTFYFFYNDSKYAPAGFVYNGTNIYFYTKNLQGDITGIADANGAVVTSYTYDAWGNVLSVTGTQASTIGTANPFRYRGYYYDTETGLFYVGSRYYDPEIGRFINADDASISFLTGAQILGANLFAYCFNNPVMLSDPDGRTPIQAVFAAIVLLLMVFRRLLARGLGIYWGMEVLDDSSWCCGWWSRNWVVCSRSINSNYKRIYFFKSKINCINSNMDI